MISVDLIEQLTRDRVALETKNACRGFKRDQVIPASRVRCSS